MLTRCLQHWAYIYCALTGESLTEGGRDALKLFTDRGWTLIINDDLIGYALAITDLMVAAISMA